MIAGSPALFIAFRQRPEWPGAAFIGADNAYLYRINAVMIARLPHLANAHTEADPIIDTYGDGVYDPRCT